MYDSEEYRQGAIIGALMTILEDRGQKDSPAWRDLYRASFPHADHYPWERDA